jgi:hypothetical protein
MTLRAFVPAALLAASVSLPAAAQQQPRPPSDTDESSRRICRISDEIGTRLGRLRTCRTKAEWDQSIRETGQVVDRLQRAATACNPWARC